MFFARFWGIFGLGEVEGLVLGLIRFVGDGLGGVGEGGEAFYDKGGGLVETTRWGRRPRRCAAET